MTKISRMVSRFVACAGAVLLFVGTASATAITYYVDASATAGGSGLTADKAFQTIGAAITKATSGDTIQIAAGTYTENLVISGKCLTLVGAGRDATIIDANKDGRALEIGTGADTTRIYGLTLKNGAAETGAGLYVDSSLTDVGFIDGGISDCISTGAGAAVNGPAWVVRTLIGRSWSTGNEGPVFTGIKGIFSSVIINCGKGFVVMTATSWADWTRNHSPLFDTYASGTQIPVVNCTICHCEGFAFKFTTSASTPVFRNTVLIGNPAVFVRQSANFQYCFSSRGGVLKNNSHNIGGDGPNTKPAYANEKWPTTHFQLFSPFEDWHILEGSDLVDAGLSSVLTDTVPAEYRDKDFYGATRVQGAAVDMGASEGAFPSATGLHFFPLAASSTLERLGTNFWFNGYRAVAVDNQATSGNPTFANGLGFASRTADRAISFAFKAPDLQNLKLYDIYVPVGTTCILTNTRWVANANFVTTIPMPPKDNVVTNHIRDAESVRWVDPENGNDSNDGLTEKTAYKTIQKGAGNVANWGIVYCKAGLYDSNGHQGYADSDNILSTSNRVYIAQNRILRALEGPEKTIIKGERSQTAAAAYDGCGVGSMRCVQASPDARAAVIGFTLTGGTTDSDPVGKEKTGKAGDSVNRGNFGGGAAAGFSWISLPGHDNSLTLVDCIVSNNVSYFGTLYVVTAKNCIFTDNRIIKTDSVQTSGIVQSSGIVGLGSRLVNCLAYGESSGVRCSWASVTTKAIGCTFIGQSLPGNSSGTTYTNCVFYGTYNVPSGNFDASIADFADIPHGDYRPSATSRFLGAGGSLMNSQFAPFYAPYMNDEVLTVGTTAAMPKGAYLSTGARTPAHWYVDASKSDDSGDGKTAATAKKTLAAVMELPLYGDIVHAAPGTYDQGMVTNTVNLINASDTGVTNRLPSRVVIPDGVTLVADQGAAVTTIKGNWVGLDMSSGQGLDAVRGVYMGNDSVLQGFTITRCSTKAGGDEHEWNCGGAVVAPKANGGRPAYIRDCVITICGGRSATAGWGGIFERCVITKQNLGSDGVFYWSILRDCLVDMRSDCYGNVSVLRKYVGVYNSTILTAKLIGDPDYLQGVTGAPIENTIISPGSVIVKNVTLKDAKNFIYVNPAAGSSYGVTIDSTCSGKIAATSVDAVLGTGCAPLSTGAAFNAGDMTLFAANPSEKDVYGNPRVRAGQVDIGAVEYDNRGDLSKALAARRVTVTDADPSAAKSSSGVTFASGEVDVSCTGRHVAGTVNFKVLGEGVLIVRDGTGKELGRWTSADGAVAYNWAPGGENPSLVFVYQASGEDDAGAVINGVSVSAGLIFIIR